MFKQTELLKFFMLALATMMLWPTILLAKSDQAVVTESSDSLSELAQAEIPIYHSYNFDANGASNCPTPAIFTYGTRTIHSYTPVYANTNLVAAIAWYELDQNLNPLSDEPLAITTFDLASGSSPVGSLWFNQNTTANLGVIFYSNTGNGWEVDGSSVYRVAASGEEVPAVGPCPTS